MERMERVSLQSQGYSAVLTNHGSHLVSWKAPDGQDVLFLSKKAIFEPPKAIRGGVPVCFPQFGMMGPLSTQHGFARNTPFKTETSTDNSCTMVLDHDGQGSFPHPLTLRLTTTLDGPTLKQAMEVTNRGDKPMPFTAALHTYYRLNDISKARIEGLSGVTFKDNLQGLKEAQDTQGAITVQGEIDRVYLKAPNTIKLVDEGSKRVVTLEKAGFPDAVVWNPWEAKAKGMADFDDSEFKECICIEPAVAGSGPIELGPGSSWFASQRISCSAL